VGDGLTLTKLRVEHPVLMLIELNQMKMKHKKRRSLERAIRFLHYEYGFIITELAFLTPTMNFTFFLSVFNASLMALTYCQKMSKLFSMITVLDYQQLIARLKMLPSVGETVNYIRRRQGNKIF
jgi:hypothetical protein